MKITIYDLTGKKKKDVDLDKDIFWITPNVGLMHEYLQYQLSSKRVNLSKTLTKWEVRWWWKKPYRQKWTWRARQWSTTNPHYVWGWIAHWPRGWRNYSKQMNKKARTIALFSYLSSKAKSWDVFGLEKCVDKINTKAANEVIKALPVERWVLFVVPESNEELSLSIRNIPNAKVILASYINPIDLTKHRKLCFVGDSLDKMKEIFTNKK